jgi:hypothetical protein
MPKQVLEQKLQQLFEKGNRDHDVATVFVFIHGHREARGWRPGGNAKTDEDHIIQAVDEILEGRHGSGKKGKSRFHLLCTVIARLIDADAGMGESGTVVC